MSMIDMIQIQGIRSVSPEEPITIKFHTPLTMIVGQNGTGKTTIIECLRYAATGQFPPNTNKGQAFVHDPKLSDKSVVKAAVRLRFRNTVGQVMMCRRVMQLTAKPKSMQLKTLDSTIQLRGENGERVDMGRTCADLDVTMAQNLGVSQAVLDYVIFCHQENSNWPLEDAKLLKEKFDLIFDATRYTRALDVIKKQRKEIEVKGKEQRIKLSSVIDVRSNAVELASTRTKQEKRLKDSEDHLYMYLGMISDLKERIERTSQALQSVQAIESDIQSQETLKYRINETIDHILNSLEREMRESDEMLQSKLASFDYEIRTLVQEVEKHTKDSHRATQNKEADQAMLQQKRLDYERLKLELESHIKRISDGMDLLAVLKKKFEMSLNAVDGDLVSDLESDNHELRQAVLLRFQEALIHLQKAKQGELEDARAALEAHQTDTNKTITTKENELRAKNHGTDLLKQKRATGVSQLTEVTDSLAALPRRSTTVELEIAESNVENLKSQLSAIKSKHNSQDHVAIKSRLEDELDEIHTTIAEYEAERAAYMKETTAHAKIEQLNGQISALETERMQLLQQLKGLSVDLLDEPLTDDTALPAVKEASNALAKQLEVKKDAKYYAAEELKDCLAASTAGGAYYDRLTAEQEKTTETIGTLKKNVIFILKKVGQYDNQEQPLTDSFDMALTELKDLLETEQETAASHVAFEDMLQRFLNVCDVNKPCPACTKPIKNKTELNALSKKLKAMFKSRSDVDCEKTKVELQGKIDDLNTVQNDRNELERLENRLPELQSELDTQEASVESADVKVDTATNKDDKLQTEVENLEEATRIAKQLVTAMESLEKINKEKVVESSKVRGPGTTVLSIDELNAILESEAEKKKSNDAKLREIDQQMFAYEREVSALDTKIMQATHEVQQIKATVSKREDLEKRRIDLQAEMDEHEVTISTAMVSVRPLEDQITKLKADTTRATKELQRMSSIAEQGYQEMCRQADRYQEVITQLQRFDAAKNSQLVEINRQATIQLQSKVEKHSALLEELSTKLAKARESLSNQAIYKKDIEANLRLRKEKKEQQAVTERIDELTVKLNASKRDEMYDKHQHLVEELEQNQRSAQRLDGVLEEIRNSIRGTDNMLNAELYRDIDKRCINEKATMESLTAVEKELGEYYKLFDDAIMQYHRLKMKEINKVIAELWTSTYTGTDIDTIEINSESDGSVSAARRTYNYRVVMRKGTADLDMKGRCSAGQKVLASLVIRLALAETFCINCGIIALDEPTANLDKLNLKNFAESLNNIIDTRRRQKNFQMIIITHDKDFLQVIGQYQKIEKYLKVYRDERQKTKVVEADLWES